MIHFIINPHSSSGSGLSIWQSLKPILQVSHISYTAHLTEYPGHAIRLAGEITSEAAADECRLAIVGGDGTLNEVLNGAHLSSDVIFHYIPTGSGNDFARGMRLPVNPEKAMAHVLNPRSVHTLDYGTAQYGEGQHERRFVVSCGIGFDAAVCHNISYSRLKKLLNRMHLGKVAYLLIGIKQILQCKMINGTLTVDGEDPIPLENTVFISCHNLAYEGGGFPFAPDALPDDGWLDLCVVTAGSRLRFTYLLLRSVLGGRHKTCKGVILRRIRQASIHLDKPLPVHTDGEVMGYFRDLDITCQPQDFRTGW